MRKLYFVFKFFFYFIIVVIVAGLAVGYGAYLKFSKDLPKLDTLKDYAPAMMSEVYSSDGTKIGEFWEDEKRVVLKPEEIPESIKKAIISAEDQSFREHKGIDYIGILRAFIENLKAGHTVQGGSTITQQVVKTFVLGNERSYERKIKEAILATRLEETFSKDEILYLYLNQIYFGNRSYGIEVASQNYFHKPAKDMTLAEAAMLAGLPKSPNEFSPIHNYDRAKIRQEYVLQRMYELGHITKNQYDKSIKEPIKIFAAPIAKEYNKRLAPWFVEEIRRMIVEKYGDKVPYTHGLKIYTTLDLKAQKAADLAVLKGLRELHKRHGYAGPLKHLATQEERELFLKDTHRKLVVESFEKDLVHRMKPELLDAQPVTLEEGKIYQALVTAIDEKTKVILVKVGTQEGSVIAKDFGWARKRNNASSGENGGLYVSNPKQVASIGDVVEVALIKPAADSKVYQTGHTYFSLEQTPLPEAALFSFEPQTGYVRAVVGGKDYNNSEFNRATQAVRQTGSVFKALLYAAGLDNGLTPDSVIQDSPISIEYAPGKFWTPENYGGGHNGAMTLKSALTYSRNVVSVRILHDYVGLDYAVGFIRKLGISTPLAKVYPMALGANDMKLMEITHAFGIFPTGGILQDLIFIRKMTDRFGSVIEENTPKNVIPFEEQIKSGSFDKLVITDRNPDNVDKYLHKDLYDPAQEWITKDKLDLSAHQKLLLYGKHIPEGYAVSPKTAWVMTSILREVVRSGTAARIGAALGKPAAGKTGTTNDLTDCWFVGFVPDLVAGVWTGYDQNKTKVGGGETGGKAAAPIFQYYMQKYLEGMQTKDFKYPNSALYSQLEAPDDIYPHMGVDDSLVEGVPGGGGGGANFFLNDL